MIFRDASLVPSSLALHHLSSWPARHLPNKAHKYSATYLLLAVCTPPLAGRGHALRRMPLTLCPACIDLLVPGQAEHGYIPDDGRKHKAPEADPRDGQAEGDGAAPLEVLADRDDRRHVGEPQSHTWNTGAVRANGLPDRRRPSLLQPGVIPLSRARPDTAGPNRTEPDQSESDRVRPDRPGSVRSGVDGDRSAGRRFSRLWWRASAGAVPGAVTGGAQTWY